VTPPSRQKIKNPIESNSMGFFIPDVMSLKKYVFPPKKAHGRITMNVTNTPDGYYYSKLCATLFQ
jgi:hypothetical protein